MLKNKKEQLRLLQIQMNQLRKKIWKTELQTWQKQVEKFGSVPSLRRREHTGHAGRKPAHREIHRAREILRSDRHLHGDGRSKLDGVTRLVRHHLEALRLRAAFEAHAAIVSCARRPVGRAARSRVRAVVGVVVVIRAETGPVIRRRVARIAAGEDERGANDQNGTHGFA